MNALTLGGFYIICRVGARRLRLYYRTQKVMKSCINCMREDLTREMRACADGWNNLHECTGLSESNLNCIFQADRSVSSFAGGDI